MTAVSPPRRIVVAGAGNVGRALGANLTRLGYDVRYAVRAPAAPDAIGLAGAAADADLTMLAVPYDAVDAVVPRLGLGDGAVLVDATNPFGRPLPDGVTSGAAFVAALAGPGVRVVKAFNVVGAEHMRAPVLLAPAGGLGREFVLVAHTRRTDPR